MTSKISVKNNIPTNDKAPLGCPGGSMGKEHDQSK